MTEIVNLRAAVKPPSDLAKRLRELADEADAGRLTDLVAAYVVSDGYDFLYGASLHNALVMATMLQARCVDRMRA